MKKILFDPLYFFVIAFMYLIFDYNFGMISMSIFCGLSLLISNLGKKFLYLQALLFIIYGLLLFIVHPSTWIVSVILILIGIVFFIFYFISRSLLSPHYISCVKRTRSIHYITLSHIICYCYH